MNILYHLHHPPGGFVLDEILALDERGHNIAVFAMNNAKENIDKRFTRANIPLCVAESSTLDKWTDLLTATTISPPLLRSTMVSAHPKYHLWTIHQAIQCIDFVKKIGFEPDLIHGHFSTRAKLSAIAASKHLGIPCTVTSHAADIYVGERFWTKLVHERVDRIVTISEYNREYIRNSIDVDTPIDVVHMGVDLDLYNPGTGGEQETIVSVSRLVEKKGIKFNILAISSLVEEFPDLEYRIIGTGPREEYLRSLIDKQGVEDSVKVLGHVSNERLKKELDNAIVFSLPCIQTEDGDRDGIPVSLMEAMATQTPPVSTNISGIPELIEHGKSGLLVDERDVSSLANTLATLLRDSDKRERIGKQAREKIQADFDRENKIDRLLMSFHEAC